MKKRRAFTIVEVLMVASLGTFLLALLTMLLIQTLESHRLIQGHLQNVVVRRDLATNLRDDIHIANEVTIGTNELAIRGEHQTITYSLSNDSVLRIEERDDTIVRQDSFFFSKLHSIEFEEDDQLDTRFFVFTLRRQLNPNANVQTEIQTVAEIGKYIQP